MPHKLYMMCVFIYYSYNTRTFDTFKKTGIPGPKPYPVLGTMMELFKHGVSKTSCASRLVIFKIRKQNNDILFVSLYCSQWYFKFCDICKK